VEPVSLSETTADGETVQDPILTVENATVSFEMSRGEARVLDDVNMDIERGEILGVVGESGSGKSMFASALLDAVRDPGQLSGDITYYPEDSDPIEVLSLTQGELNMLRWDEMSMVFQGSMASFNPTMKIRDHFTETIRAHGADREERMEYVSELMEMLHLDTEKILESYPHELSGGMTQRALIALSLVLEPEVLVMDEPTSALDLLMQRSIINMLSKLREELDLTMVFITHDMPLVSGLCDRIAVMYAFEFIEEGPKREVLLNAAHPYTRALLRSVPSVGMDPDEIQIIEGMSPDPVNVPSGCSYNPRCDIADERCTIEDPELVSIDEDHRAACFYTDDARREIDYTLGKNEWKSEQ